MLDCTRHPYVGIMWLFGVLYQCFQWSCSMKFESYILCCLFLPTHVVVHVCGRGFESHFLHHVIFFCGLIRIKHPFSYIFNTQLNHIYSRGSHSNKITDNSYMSNTVKCKVYEYMTLLVQIAAYIFERKKLKRKKMLKSSAYI